MIGDFTFPEKANFSKEAKNLISLLLKNDPKKDISVACSWYDWFSFVSPFFRLRPPYFTKIPNE